jgi:hypothetical protein
MVFPVKVFSADGLPNDGVGAWKDKSSGGHTTKFNDAKFITYYESFATDNTAFLQINFPKAHKDAILPPNFDFIRNLDLAKVCQNYAKTFINKELDYYAKYQNEALEYMEEFYLNLLNNCNSGSKFLLRIGANVGFHSITGDWKIQDHLQSKGSSKFADIRKRDANPNELIAKTRKFAFSTKKNELHFEPMGWLCLEPIEEVEYKQGIENEREKWSAKNNETSRPNQIGSSTILPNINAVFQGKLKEGADLEAKVVKVESPFILVEYQIAERNPETILLRYPAGRPIGAIVVIRVNNLNRRTLKIESVGFVKDK